MKTSIDLLLIRCKAHGKAGLVTTVKADEYFFHDVADAAHWASKLRPQPVIKSPLTNAAYTDVPCAYLQCTLDKVFPLPVQEMMVKTATDLGGDVKIYPCESGHAPFLSRNADFLDAVEDFAAVCQHYDEGAARS